MECLESQKSRENRELGIFLQAGEKLAEGGNVFLLRSLGSFWLALSQVGEERAAAACDQAQVPLRLGALRAFWPNTAVTHGSRANGASNPAS